MAGTASLDAATDTWSFDPGLDHAALVPLVSYDRGCFCSWIGEDRETTVRGVLRITSLTADRVRGRVMAEGEFSGAGFGPIEWSLSHRFDVDR